ncbi:MAG: nucleotide exchange factor GrpE [Defluviitaleaceae bacterium]|nr:nucleotide exchange factor GrpE [Defluviitaleaceae bacterium]
MSRYPKPRNRQRTYTQSRESKILRLWQRAVTPIDTFCAILSENIFNIPKSELSENFFTETRLFFHARPGTEQYNNFLSKLKNISENNIPQFDIEETTADFAGKLETLRIAFTAELHKEILHHQHAPAESGRHLSNNNAGNKLASEISMTDGIRAIFKKIADFYERYKFQYSVDSTENRIIKGIAETMQIKSESLDEGLTALKESIASCINKPIEPPNPLLPPWIDTVSAAAFNTMVQEMAVYQKGDRRALSAVKKYLNFTVANEIYAPYAVSKYSPADKIAEQVDGLLTKFKKEHTLYEITTFEEIMLHSAPRIREASHSNEAIGAFVALLDDATATIASALGHFGISPIQPTPGTMFNGQYHEVLTAETDGNFKKGEIIKLLNSGFKQGDRVILRANVIAAK